MEVGQKAAEKDGCSFVQHDVSAQKDQGKVLDAVSIDYRN